MSYKQKASNTNRAKSLRKKMSPPELLIWHLLRPKVNKEFNLRRQTPLLDRFVVDFYFDGRRVAFEIDGRQFHEDRVDFDIARDVLLADSGITVIRIGAYQVFEDSHLVANFIRTVCMGQIAFKDIEPSMITIGKGAI